MKKCERCGREGTAPHVRGAKSAAVSIGNYRMAVDVDVELCDRCADAIMGVAMGKLIVLLETGRS